MFYELSIILLIIIIIWSFGSKHIFYLSLFLSFFLPYFLCFFHIIKKLLFVLLLYFQKHLFVSIVFRGRLLRLLNIRWRIRDIKFVCFILLFCCFQNSTILYLLILGLFIAFHGSSFNIINYLVLDLYLFFRQLVFIEKDWQWRWLQSRDQEFRRW